ncbi:MAG: serine dehydrogenasease [Bacteroidales bacterium]|nr:serine dehydrogenasease [Bacteroidales bacterium]MBR5604033.1 serine dehydrogenasease [Bacteroidales bacterium]
MENLVDKALKEMISNALLELEDIANSDVLCYSGPIVDGNENVFLDIIEELADSPDKRDSLMVVLTTTGGSAMAVERYVNIIRKHYEKVSFVVPDYAYSAGTIFCMSGDEIWMDYFSVLGPIDPQVKNKEGKFVPALGYLDKVNSLIDKARNGSLTNAEFLILKDFDLAELRAYEQAKELTVTLLKKWLVKYKFKNWDKHKNGNSVTMAEKEKRAEEIADKLGDNNIWKSHARPICIEELENLKLKIEDYSDKETFRKVIRRYYNLSKDMINKYGLNIFIQTRKYL